MMREVNASGEERLFFKAGCALKIGNCLFLKFAVVHVEVFHGNTSAAEMIIDDWKFLGGKNAVTRMIINLKLQLFHLPALKTLFIGQVFHDLREVPSTNDYALQLLAKSNPAEGTVVSTPHQTAGKGQRGSQWITEAGENITLSVILRPTFLSAHVQFQLNQAMSLAACRMLESRVDGEVKIKWPNDLYIGDKKVGGILIQNAISGQHLRSSVVGIGINVNQKTFPTNLPNPTSLLMECGAQLPLQPLIADLLQQVEAEYLKLKSGKIVPLQSAYLDKLYRLGEFHDFEKKDGSTFHGKIIGVDEAGRLCIFDGMQEHHFNLKEIRFVI